jgi:hypothetical protein
MGCEGGYGGMMQMGRLSRRHESAPKSMNRRVGRQRPRQVAGGGARCPSRSRRPWDHFLTLITLSMYPMKSSALPVPSPS